MAVECPECKTSNPKDSKFCKECATPLPDQEGKAFTKTMETPREELTTGSTFAGRYQIIEELGKGGMGKVYKAVDNKLKEKVALKLIKPEIVSDKKTLERFGNELKIARKIVHKNVGRMYELMEEKGAHFITMEYVSGQDLKGLIRQSAPLSIAKTIRTAKQICDGLAEAHKLGIIHRDLKPSNIMIDREGNARIMDFGIARSLKGKGITGAGVMIGTPEYMSPEQVEAKDVDQRSDIYSLGIILYEMATGQLPFEADTPFAVGVMQKSEIPKNPKELNPQVSDNLNQVILKCLEKDNESRYQSAGEVRSELESIEKGIPTTEREAPKRTPLTSKEITVSFSTKKLLIPTLVFIALIVSAVIIWQFLPRKESDSLLDSKPSVAVLPFEDLSPQKDQTYFCDGLADELINRLTRLESLKVPARTSSFSFKGKGLNIQEIGESLNVDTIVEGSVRKASNKLRITVQLVNAHDGYPLWSEKFDRDVGDIFTLQDEISLAIVDNLKVKLLGNDKSELLKSHTQNLEAYDLYLKGRYFLAKRAEEEMKKSIQLFEKAIEADPSFALAYTGLADAYAVLATWGFLPAKDAYKKAKEAVKKALELDNSLSEAHSALAGIYMDNEWDWESAEREFQQAIELNPNNATAHLWYAEYFLCKGRYDEALREIDRALEVDPLSLIINSMKGLIFALKKDYDKAIDQLHKTLEMDPHFFAAHWHLGSAYLEMGEYEKALVEFKKTGDTSIIGIVYASMGNIEEARKMLEALKKEAKNYYIRNLAFANLHIALGDYDQGFFYFEKAFEEREVNMKFLKVIHFYDNIRSDPRFIALMKKMDLE